MSDPSVGYQAMLGLAAAAVQAAVQIADPVMTILASLLVSAAAAMKKQSAWLDFGITVDVAKRWICALASLAIAWVLVSQCSQLDVLGSLFTTGSGFITALLLAVGADGVNSLVKYASYAKTAKKQQLDESSAIDVVTPAPSVQQKGSTQIVVKDSSGNDAALDYQIPNPAAGTISSTGLFTAGTAPGTYDLIVSRRGQPKARAIVKITVTP